MNIEGSSTLPSSDSFQFYIPLTSTPKRSAKSTHCQPLSSTLAVSMESSQKLDLSLSAIASVKQSPILFRRSNHHRRRTQIQPSTITKRIELKYLLYSNRAMKSSKQRDYIQNDMKIYVV